MGITFGSVPEIGDDVNLPNGKKGVITSASISLLRARLTNQVYYKVHWLGPKPRSKWFSYHNIVPRIERLSGVFND